LVYVLFVPPFYSAFYAFSLFRVDYCEIAQNMEIQCLKLMIPDLMVIPLIRFCVHDKDSRANKTIKDFHWNIRQLLDPNHALKSFDRMTISYNSKHNGILADVIEPLRRFMRWLIKASIDSVDEKKQYWDNCVNHFCGDHSGCPFVHTAEIPVWSGASNHTINLVYPLYARMCECTCEMVKRKD
jgi:hypothetical protein